MLSVSMVDWWLARQWCTRSGHPDQPSQHDCVIIPSGGCCPPERLDVQPGGQAGVPRAGDEDCGRSGRDPRPGVSGPSPGTRALRLHLVMIPAGTRDEPHYYAAETAAYLVSGQAEMWHGTGLAKRSVIRAGDYIYVPPGAPHLAVNHGDVTAVAVVASNDPAGWAAAVLVELPGHLAALRRVPISDVPVSGTGGTPRGGAAP
jgi:uncharacterized RmlC-like cupin family protein